MSIQTVKKELQELKRAAAFQKKNAEDELIKNMTDEELQQAIEDDIRSMGFESDAHFLDCAKQFILERDENANVSHEFAVHDCIFGLFEDFKIFEEFMLKYSSVEFEK